MIRFIKKILSIKIKYRVNTVYISVDKELRYHKCEECSRGYWAICKHKLKDYAYEFTDDKFKLEFQDKIESDDFKIYGWVIQERYIGNTDDKLFEEAGWYDYWNHKVFGSKEIAFDALNQINKSTLGYKFNNYKYRVKPVYHLNKIGTRNMIISEILKK